MVLTISVTPRAQEFARTIGIHTYHHVRYSHFVIRWRRSWNAPVSVKVPFPQWWNSGALTPGRNHRAPTGTDTPTFSAASAEVMPVAISRQNSRCTARDGSGRPGERIGGRNARSARHCRRTPSGTSIVFAIQSFLANLAHLHTQGVATTN